MQLNEHVTFWHLSYLRSPFHVQRLFWTNICHCACSLLADLLDAFIFLRCSNVSACSSCWKREGWYYGPERVAGSAVSVSHWPSWSCLAVVDMVCWASPFRDGLGLLHPFWCDGIPPLSDKERMHWAEMLRASQRQWSITWGWWEAVFTFCSLFRRKEIISRDNQRFGWLSHFSCCVSSIVYARWKNVLHPKRFFFLPVENLLINSINSYHQTLRRPSSSDSTQTAMCVYLNVSGFNLFLYHPPLTCLTQFFRAWASVVAAHSGHSSAHGGNMDLTSGHK